MSRTNVMTQIVLVLLGLCVMYLGARILGASMLVGTVATVGGLAPR